MANYYDFRENIEPIKDLVKYMPENILNPKYLNVTWSTTPYGNIVIRLTGGSLLYHHVDIIFRGNGVLKIYFYKLPTVAHVAIEYQCFGETEADIGRSKHGIMNILRNDGKFELE